MGEGEGFTLHTGNMTFSGIINGSGPLTKTGAGTLQFSGSVASPNTYSGLTTVSAGTLDLNKTAGILDLGRESPRIRR